MQLIFTVKARVKEQIILFEWDQNNNLFELHHTAEFLASLS